MSSKNSFSPRPELPKSGSKSKLPSPKKLTLTRFSPIKLQNNSKIGQASKDYFTITPIRQNKSLTSSTPDLSNSKPKGSSKEMSGKKIILDQGKLLQDKLKEFKTKIKSNAISAFTTRTSISQGTLFCSILDKFRKKEEKKRVSEVFGLIKEVLFEEFNKPLMVFKSKVKEKCWKILKEWKKDKGDKEVAEFEAEFEENEEDSEIFMIADVFYKSSLKLFFGLRPWKRCWERGKRVKVLRKLASENYQCKLMVKGFSGIFKYYQDSIQKPRKFRNAYLMQKTLAKLGLENKTFSAVVEKFRVVIPT